MIRFVRVETERGPRVGRWDGETAEVTAEEVNAAYRAAADGPLKAYLQYTADPIVSSDIVRSPYSCTFDSLLTMTMPSASGITLVKVQGWYDNEWGYANRLVDLARIMGAAGA